MMIGGLASPLSMQPMALTKLKVAVVELASLVGILLLIALAHEVSSFKAAASTPVHVSSCDGQR
jgi:hypothetical protein